MKLIDKTMKELLELRRRIQNDPANKEIVPGSPDLYDTKARKKLHRIDRAINDLIIERKKREGTWKPCSGYSGRKSNRRR